MKTVWLMLLTAPCVALGNSNWQPFPMETATSGTPALDLSHFLEEPAGAQGPIALRDGHLVKANGTRWRIWGVNVTGGACFPEKEDAPQVARHLARFGINCVRFHFLDSNWGREASLWDPERNDTQALDPQQMDRLDTFVKALKDRGIYSNFNLNVGRVYRSGDGVRDYEWFGLGKALQYFNPRIQQLHRDYARLLLTHRNPYTGSEYRHEPALALVELVNENSIVESWFNNRLRGEQNRKGAGTWSDIPASYARELTEAYNQWLARSLDAKALAALRLRLGLAAGELVPRLQPDDFDSAETERFQGEARFYMSLEAGYFRMMEQFLKKSLGMRALLVANSDHNHYKSGYPLLTSTSLLDVVDGHIYWQHPNYHTDPDTGKRGFRIQNTPMVDDPAQSTVVQLARSRVAGKPYTVSETNHPFPNEYACEGIPILAAYALLHDWDGIFFYTFAHSDPREWGTRRPGHFDIGVDPVKMASLASAGFLFHRRDVKPAATTLYRSYTEAQVIESLRLDSAKVRPFFTPGFTHELCLIHNTAIRSFEEETPSYPPYQRDTSLTSDTDELVWQTTGDNGLVTINTPKTQAFIGHVQNQPPSLPNLEIDMETPFACVFMTSMDGLPLTESRRILLCTTARSALTGMQWNEKRTSLTAWGQLPMVMEPVVGRVTLKHLATSGPYRMRRLDGAGMPGQPTTLPRTHGGKVEIAMGRHTTPWLMIEWQE